MTNFTDGDHPRDRTGRFARKATAADPGRLAGLASQQPAGGDPEHLTAAAAAVADCGHHLNDRDDDQGGCCGWCGEPKDTDLDRLASPEAAAPPESLRRIAAHPDVPPSTLDRLADHPDEAVRFTVADNPATPPGTLDRLAATTGPGGEFVRLRVAHNSSTPPGALDRLTGDPDTAVRGMVAFNAATPPETLTRLTGDPSPAVAAQAAAALEARELRAG